MYLAAVAIAALFLGPWVLAILVGFGCALSPALRRWVQEVLFGQSTRVKGQILPIEPEKKAERVVEAPAIRTTAVPSRPRPTNRPFSHGRARTRRLEAWRDFRPDAKP